MIDVRGNIIVQNSIDIDDEDNFFVNTTLKSNDIPLLKENEFLRMNTNNGYSKDRTLKHLASIPYVAYLKAQADGYNLLNDKDFNKYISLHPEYMIGDDRVRQGSNSHKIIVK